MVVVATGLVGWVGLVGFDGRVDFDAAWHFSSRECGDDAEKRKGSNIGRSGFFFSFPGISDIRYGSGLTRVFPYGKIQVILVGSIWFKPGDMRC
jgi:hypothetical protein